MAKEDGVLGTKSKRILMWVNPRSLSTSFEKFVGFMDGAKIWHEPYTTCYYNGLYAVPNVFERFPMMKHLASQIVRAKEVIGGGGHIYQNGNLSPIEKFTRDWVKEQIERPLKEGEKFMFIKDVAMGIDGHYDKLPEVDVKHTFIIRHPYRQALSARRLLIRMSGYERDPDDFDASSGCPWLEWEKLSKDPLFQLWKYIRENIDPNPIVIDADDLQNDSKQILRKYCEAVGIPFKKEYLKWEKSDVSLKYFHGCLEQMVLGKTVGAYDAAFLSSEFLPISSEIPESLPEKCLGYMREFEEGYKVMYETRIKLE